MNILALYVVKTSGKVEKSGKRKSGKNALHPPKLNALLRRWHQPVGVREDTLSQDRN